MRLTTRSLFLILFAMSWRAGAAPEGQPITQPAATVQPAVSKSTPSKAAEPWRMDTTNLHNAIIYLKSALGKEKYPRAAEFLQRLDALEKAPDVAQREALQREALLGGPEKLDPKALRDAIVYLTRSFGKKYPRGAEFLQRLDALEKAPDAAQLAALQRQALIANPLVSGQPVLFVARKQYPPNHHNTETMFQTGEFLTKKFTGGGSLKLIDFAKGGESRVLVDPGADGMVRDPEVYFDGSKVVFSMRRNVEDDYHIYEVKTDGSGLKQLTSASGVFDIDPFYLPDDNIVFTSSREPKYCMCNRHMMGNLYRMEPDGANIVQIGKNTLFEGHGSLMADGRILYDRWEYVDRNYGDAEGLWTMNPDGTAHAIYYKNNTGAPGATLEGRTIPGTSWVICTFSSCHDRPWGAIAIVDRSKGVDGRPPVVRTWPADGVEIVNEKGHWDAFTNISLKYEDPYPLSDKFFLCSRMTGQCEQTGIYLLDTFGNELLLHTEGEGCFDPMPLGARPRPPVLPTRRAYDNSNGTFYVQDVYEGTHMAGVKRGSVKYLRVVEEGEKRSYSGKGWDGQGWQAPGMNWHDFSNKRILGTVPVEEDGSAHFTVPSGKFIFFQLLDENKRMIQSMRSGTTIQPGETQGCIGCHEDRLSPPQASRTIKAALKRAPSPMNGWYGPARSFSYRTEVQPILDRKCVSCHDFGKEAGAKLNLAGDRGMVFNASYFDLWSKNIIKEIGGGPAQLQPAYSWGSNASPLTKVLDGGGHIGGAIVEPLTQEEKERITTWMDLNAPYYPDYMSAYPLNPFGRCPLDEKQIKRLNDLGIKLDLATIAERRKNAMAISFDRPELSPCLAGFANKEDPNYIEALSILNSAKAALEKVPEADAPGFIPCEENLERNRKYEAWQKIEQRNREALSAGKKAYDLPSVAVPLGASWKPGDTQGSCPQGAPAISTPHQ